MNDNEKLSLEQIRAFLEASEGTGFQSTDKRELYEWVNRTLLQQGYERLKRRAKGLVRRYVAKMTGLSRAQVTRLIACYTSGEEVKLKPYRRRRFASRYSRADIGLLAQTDEAHDTLSGPATVKIMEREHTVFHKTRYERLKGISVAHLYRLRNTKTYRKLRINVQLTKPAKVAIGERRKPAPGGKPGYLRVDTVHQGDRDGVKGVYHINAVDEVTQFQVVAAVPAICEAFVLPMLEAMFQQFPFRIRGFHSDNGSEYINYDVEALLKTLLVQQTKSRPRRSNDNGLVECKNGAVIRKHMGYGHIPPEHAPELTKFYRESFNPYLNFHRPCGIPTIQVADNGKEKRIYREYATPFEILKQIPNWETFLRPSITAGQLERDASVQSDTDAARQMQRAKSSLFDRLSTKPPRL